MKNNMSFLKKLKIKLSNDSAIPLLCIHWEKTIIQKDTCTSVFTAALFTIARKWKQLKCPPREEWIPNAGDARDTGSIPGWERSPGRRHGNPLQYSHLENPHGQRSLRATVHGVTKSQTGLRN